MRSSLFESDQTGGVPDELCLKVGFTKCAFTDEGVFYALIVIIDFNGAGSPLCFFFYISIFLYFFNHAVFNQVDLP